MENGFQRGKINELKFERGITHLKINFQIHFKYFWLNKSVYYRRNLCIPWWSFRIRAWICYKCKLPTGLICWIIINCIISALICEDQIIHVIKLLISYLLLKAINLSWENHQIKLLKHWHSCPLVQELLEIHHQNSDKQSKWLKSWEISHINFISYSVNSRRSHQEINKWGNIHVVGSISILLHIFRSSSSIWTFSIISIKIIFNCQRSCRSTNFFLSSNIVIINL